jgi:hypothetical protein
VSNPQYYIKAKLSNGNSTNLTISYLNNGTQNNKTIEIFSEEYAWYKFSSEINLTNSTVTLFAIDDGNKGNISIDKGVFLKVSDTKPFNVTTTNDSDDTIEFGDGGGNITVNITIPINGNIRRFIASASMNISGVVNEIGKGHVEDQAVNYSAMDYFLPDIVISNGNIHVVYEKVNGSGVTNVYYINSSDNGTTWLDNPVLIGPYNISHGTPSIEVYEDYVHVIFVTLQSPRKIYYRRNAIGGGPIWLENYTILTENNSYSPKLAVDGENLHIVWYDDRDGNYEIYYKKGCSNGDYWLSDIKLTNTSNSSTFPEYPDIAAECGYVHIIYQQIDSNASNISKIYYVQLNNDGRKIINNTQINSHLDWNVALYWEREITDRIAVNGPNIYVVWEGTPNGSSFDEIQLKMSSNNGYSWEQTYNITNTEFHSNNPCISVDPTNDLTYIFWLEDIFGGDHYRIYYRRSTDKGKTWNSSTEFSDEFLGPCDPPSASADGTGNFHVIWKDMAGPGPYYNYIKNYIPELPSIDVGNDSTLDFSPQAGFNVEYPIYDFSQEINEYIKENENQISNGYIKVPLRFQSESYGNIKVKELDINLILDISDPNDIDVDSDNILDSVERYNYLGIVYPTPTFKHFDSSPAMYQSKVMIISSPPTFGYMTNIVCGNKNGYFYNYKNLGYQLQTFQINWKYFVGSPIYSSPAIANIDPTTTNSEIVFGADDGYLYYLDTNGVLQSRINLGGGKPIRSSPAVANIYDDVTTDFDNQNLEVIVGTDNNEVLCIGFKFRIYYGSSSQLAPNLFKLIPTGIINYGLTILWRFKTGGKVRSSPTVGDINNDGKLEVIFGSDDGKIYCLNQNGNLLWSYDTQSPVRSTAGIADIDNDEDLEIVIGSDNAKIYCLNFEGDYEWIYTLSGAIRSSPAIGNINPKSSHLEIVVSEETIYGSTIRSIVFDKFSDNFVIGESIFVSPFNKPKKRINLITVDLDQYPDGGYEIIASDGFNIYQFDNYFNQITKFTQQYYGGCPIIADFDNDGKLEITTGLNKIPPSQVEYVDIKQTNINCPPSVIKWGMFCAGDKHNGNGDNRYAIIIGGSKGDNGFERGEFRAGIQTIARLLTSHSGTFYAPNSSRPAYSGHYLQNNIFYIGIYNNIPEITRDKSIPNNGQHDTTGKTNILWAITKIANYCDSYDNILFFYTSHGRYLYTSAIIDPNDEDEKYKKRVYLFDANNHHTGSWSNRYSKTGDLNPNELNGALDKITCQKLSIIIQPCYSGDWIDYLDDEENRIILTSEYMTENVNNKRDKLSVFDKCNIVNFPSSPNPETVYYIGDSGTDNSNPMDDAEEYTSDANSVPQYRVKNTNLNDDLYEIDKATSGSWGEDYKENFNDYGAEFVSGITEAFYIDRDSTGWGIVPYLDADQIKNNGAYSTIGDSNGYVSYKEAYRFMKVWHVTYRIGTAPTNEWYDFPQIIYTGLAENGNYLLY